MKFFTFYLEFSEFTTNSPASPIQTSMVDNSSSFSDNSDDQDSSLNTAKLSPLLNRHHHSSNNKINQQQMDKKKKPAPKPPPSMTSSQSSLQSTNIDLSPTGSLTSSSKIRPKIASFKFQKPPAINKPTLSEHGENITIIENKFSRHSELIMKGSNRVESPPAAIYLTTGGPVTSSLSPGIYLRKSPESMTTFRPQAQGITTTKIRPKSVCERPMVAPPSVPPRPSLTPKQSKAEMAHQNSKPQQQQLSSNDNIQLIDKYPEFNHIDSESDDQSSRSSKDLSDLSLQQKVLINFKKDSTLNDEGRQSPIYPSLEKMIEKDDDDDEEMKIPSEPETTPPPPRKPPRTHSSNSSTGSSSNLSINDGRESILDTTSSLSPKNLKKQHQRSASTSISTSNNNNNPDIDDNSKLNLNSSNISQSKTHHQTYL